MSVSFEVPHLSLDNDPQMCLPVIIMCLDMQSVYTSNIQEIISYMYTVVVVYCAFLF